MDRSFILGLLATIVSVSSDSYHPREFKCLEEGLRHDSQNCRKFYWCNLSESKLTPLQLECDRGMIFDIDTQICTYPALSTREECKGEMISNEIDAGRSISDFRANSLACTQEGFISDDQDCQKFYRCVGDGKGSFMQYEFSCGDGTVWDPDISGCNHAWAVKNEKCRIGMSTATEENKEPGNPNYGNPSSVTTGSNQENIDNPNHNYNPDSGAYPPAPVNGQNNYNNYDPNYGSSPSSILPPLQTEKSTTAQPVSTSTQPSQSSSEISEQSTETATEQNKNEANLKNDCQYEGFLADFKDCKKFYRCVPHAKGFTKYEFTCGQGTAWDPEIDNCNYPSAIKSRDCAKSTEATAEGSPGQGSSSTDNPVPTTNGFGSSTVASAISSTSVQTTSEIASSSTETTSVALVEQSSTTSKNEIIPISSTIPTTTLSNKEETLVSSTIEASQSTTPSNKEESGPGTKCSQEGFMGDANDCKKFYRCVHNGKESFMKYEFTCGDGTVWDSEISSCNYPWATKNSKCGTGGQNYSNTTISNEINTSSTSAGDGSNGSSTEQITMVSTSSTTVEPSTEVNPTDASLIEPTEPSSVQSSTVVLLSSEATTVPGFSESTTENINKKPGQGCAGEDFLPDPQDCKKFYRCANDGKGAFIKHEFTCGEGTVWDSDLNTCNYPRDVKGSCGNKDISEQATTQSSASTNGEETSSGSESSSEKGEINENTSTASASEQSSSTIFSTESTTSESGQSSSEVSISETTSSGTELSEVTTPGGTHQTTSKTPTSESASEAPQSTFAPSNITLDYCTQEGFIGDSNDCKKFYRCVNNGKGGFTKYEFSCGEGTVWDSDQSTCNYRWAVKNKCNNLSENESGNKEENSSISVDSTTEGITTSSSELIDNNSSSESVSTIESFTTVASQSSESTDTNIISTTDGTTTLSAQSSEVTTSSSSMSTEPNSISQSTESVQTSSSSHESITQQAISTTTTGPATTKSECVQDGFIGDSQDCKKFYRCVDNGKGSFIKYEFSCGEGTVWDSDQSTCNYPSAVKNKCNSLPGNESGNKEVDSTTQSVTTSSSESIDGNSSSESIVSTIESSTAVSSQSSESTDTSISSTIAATESTQSSEATTLSSTESISTGSTTVPEQTSSSSPDSTTAQAISTTPAGLNNQNQTNTAAAGIQTKCEKEGFLGDSQDCKKFYRCVDNGKGGFTKYEFACGEGTVWDSELTTCNYASAVKSENCGTGKPETLSTDSPLSQVTDGTSTQTENSSSTETPEKTTISAPTETPEETKTDLPNTPSTTEQANTVTPTETTISEQVTITPEPTTISVTPTQSSQTEPAVTPTTTKIPEPIQTDQPTTTAEQLTTVQIGTSTDKSDSSTASPNSEATTSTTPSIPESTTTELTSTTTDSTESSSNPASQTTESTGSALQNTCSQEGFMPNLQDCKKFIRCVGNGKGGYTKYDFSCGEGTIWDPDLDTCNWPYAVQNKKCESTAKPGGQESTTSQSITTSSTSKPSGSTASPSTTLKPGGEESSTSKPGGQESTTPESNTTSSTPNPSGSTASPSSTANPGGEVSSTSKPSETGSSTTSTAKPDTTTPIPQNPAQADKCTGEGFFPNSKDCKKFYRCVSNGKGSYTKYDFTCGEGTIWDPTLDTCNYPWAVETKACGSGQTIDATTEKESPTEATSSTTVEATSESTDTTTHLSETTTEIILTTTNAGTDPQTQSTVVSEITTQLQETTTADVETTEGITSTNKPETEATTSGIETTTSGIETTTLGTETTTSEIETTTTALETTTSEALETTTSEIKTTSEVTTESGDISTTIELETTSNAIETTTSEIDSTTSVEVTTNTEANTTESQVDSTTTESSQATTIDVLETTIVPETTTVIDTTTDSVTESSTDSSLTTTGIIETTTDEVQTTELASTTEITETTESQTDVSTVTPDSSETTTNQISSTFKPDQNQTTPCPISQLEGDQVSLVCPTGFKRHPKYCNLFYQCTTNPDTFDIKVLVLSCPNDTIYDDTKIQCLPPGETKQTCTGQLAEKKNYRRSNDDNISPMIIDSERPLCPSEGSFPLQPTECDSNFIKCKRSERRTMRGFVYQCPENYTYWPISKRCEPQSEALKCDTNQIHKTKWQIPTEEVDVALRTIVVYQ